MIKRFFLKGKHVSEDTCLYFLYFFLREEHVSSICTNCVQKYWRSAWDKCMWTKQLRHSHFFHVHCFRRKKI